MPSLKSLSSIANLSALQSSNQSTENMPNKLTKSPVKKLITIELHLWEEMVGQCTGIFVKNDELTIDLSGNGQQFRIIVPKPRDSFTLADMVSKWVGVKMGVLKTDSQTAPVALRIVEENVENDCQ